MRILVASDNDHVTRQIQETLSRHALECPAAYCVPLEVAPERAARLLPDVILFVLMPDPQAGLQALRETSSTIQKAYVAGIGPGSDAKLILRVLHEGADEYLDEAVLERELTAALARFKAKRLSRTGAQQQKAGRVLSVLGPSGGSGSSTVAANMSASLAQVGGECGLIDLRLAAGDLASMFDLKPTYTIAELCDCVGRLDQSMFEQFLVRHRSGVCLLPAPRDLADIKRVTSKGVRRALTMARVRFPYVVADLDNALDSEQVEALWQSDLIVLVMRLDYTSLRNTRRIIDNLVEMGLGADRVRVVVNGYRQRRQLRLMQIEQALGMDVYLCIPYDPGAVNRAVNSGVPVVLGSPRVAVSKCLRKLALSLNGCEER